jgi:hypothetical protein
MKIAKRSRLSTLIAALLAVIAFLSLTKSVQAQNPGVLGIRNYGEKVRVLNLPSAFTNSIRCFEPIQFSGKGSGF